MTAHPRRPRMRGDHALLLLLLVLAGYGGSLYGEFVWDDRMLIVENERVHQVDRLGELLTSSFWETGDRHDRFRAFFRPVVGFSYFVDHALWKFRPWGYHMTNLLLHLGCCVLVYGVARRERIGDWPAFVAAGLFAVHPVHVESVAWISGRTDLLCALLMLGAFALYRRACASSRPTAGTVVAGVLFLFALLAKEMAVTLPLLVALDRWNERRRLRDALQAAAPFLVVLGIYAVVRHATIGSMGEPLFTLGAGGWLATASFAVARYLTLLILPIGLDAHYPYEALNSLLSPVTLVAVAMLAVLGFAIRYLIRHSPAAGFWALWIVVTLGPVLTFGRFGDVIMADRFLYVPSVGLALIAAHAVAWCATNGSRAGTMRLATAVALVLGLLTVATAVRGRVWRDDHSLFSDMARTSPDSALVRANLGLTLYQRGEVEPAIDEYRQAIELEPTYSMAYNNLAVALESAGRHVEALELYQAALRLVPEHLEVGINAGHLLSRIGQPERGERMLRDVVLRHAGYPAAHYALAEVLVRRGNLSEAMNHLDTARRLQPDYANVYYLMGKIRYEQGRLDQAAGEMRAFLELWPHEQDAWTAAARQVIRRADSARGADGSAP